MTMTLIWFAGTLSAGHLIIEAFIWWLGRLSRTTRFDSRSPFTGGGDTPSVPAWFTGLFERTLAFVLVYCAITSAGAMLAGWIVAKLATNWTRSSKADFGDEVEGLIRTRSLIALMAGVVSLGIGATGGFLARAGY